MMAETDEELARLREAFLSGSGDGVLPPDAPSAERIWDAAAGRLPPDELRSLLDEVAAHPASARMWSTARRILEGQEHAEPGAFRPPTVSERPGWKLWSLAAALALVAVGLTAGWRLLRAPAEPNYRGGERSIESLLPDDADLPREQAVLRWQEAPGARRYNVRLLGADYAVLLVKDGLTTPTFRIPPEALAGIRDGDSVLWQVEAVYPDGAGVLSETFRTRIVGPAAGTKPEGD